MTSTAASDQVGRAAFRSTVLTPPRNPSSTKPMCSPGSQEGRCLASGTADVGPRAIAVQSWQNISDNGASGSMDMRDLVALARTEFA